MRLDVNNDRIEASSRKLCTEGELSLEAALSTTHPRWREETECGKGCGSCAINNPPGDLMSSPNFFSRSSLTDEPLVHHQLPFNSPKRRLEVDISPELLFFNETCLELTLSHARGFRIVLKWDELKMNWMEIDLYY